MPLVSCTPFDVAIIGGGPAGAACAAFCAEAGLRTLVLERAQFPREKVCGDCVNPACWPIFDRLGLSEKVRALPHSRLSEVRFIGIGARSLRFPLPDSERGEIAVKRSLLDKLLLDRAAELGADIRQNTALTTVESGWLLRTSAGEFCARTLVGADGRNSTVARLLGLLPAAARDRVALQTHLAAPPAFGDRVVMRFLPHGYCGLASVGGGQLNLCVVATPARIDAAKAWAAREFALTTGHTWRTITPLSRRAAVAAHANLLLAGDAARVVEPFTGEGIYYALASGELAARHIIAGGLAGYAAAHARLFRGRLWINQLARLACLHPRMATLALDLFRLQPELLRGLTSRVITGSPSHTNPTP